MAKTIFDFLKKYDTNGWVEVESRKFTPEELKLMGKCTVIRGDYSLAVKVELPPSQFTCITLDKRENVKVGDVIPKENLCLVHLKYEGDNPKVKVTECLVLRIEEEETPVSLADVYNNPFGL